MRIRTYTALFLYLSAFFLSALARADQVMPMVMPADMPPSFSHSMAVDEHAGQLMLASSHGCSEHEDASGKASSFNSSCQNTADCSPDHCFSSQGMVTQPLGVIPFAAREHFISDAHHLLSLVLAPPGRPPRYI